MIERYVLGQLSLAEGRMIEAAASSDLALRARLNGLQDDLAALAQRRAISPPSDLKARIFSTIAEQNRSDRPPILHQGSKASDYSRWIDGPDMTCPTVFDEVHFLEFGDDPDAMSALVWVKHGSPAETHTDCVEKFLILEGTCEVELNGTVQSLSSGDVFSIPLYTVHTVKVTSPAPCKFILQRIAA